MATTTKTSPATSPTTPTIDRITIPKNRVDVGVPYRPVKVTKTGKPEMRTFIPSEYGTPVDSNGRYVEWYPTGFNPNEHKYLLLVDFSKPVLWYVYKSCVQHTWFVRHQQCRIAYWQSCADQLMNPNAKRKQDMTPDEINRVEMKRLNMTPEQYAVHIVAQITANL